MRRERLRQQMLVELGRIPFHCAMPDISGEAKLAVLVEEVGEVARALNDRTELVEELIQVAAVALAWIESLEK